jgi:hypothetical protein
MRAPTGLTASARLVWAGWKVLARKVADVQARVLLGVLYIALVPPFALIVRLGPDPLRLRPPGASNWTPWGGRPSTPEAWRRQS